MSAERDVSRESLTSCACCAQRARVPRSYLADSTVTRDDALDSSGLVSTLSYFER